MGNMKIYSSRKHELNPLAKFAGKDLWVECYYYNDGDRRWRFFKVLKADGSGSTVLSIPAGAVNHSRYYKTLDDMIAAAPTMYLDADEVEVISPVNTLTTEDLEEMFNLPRE